MCVNGAMCGVQYRHNCMSVMGTPFTAVDQSNVTWHAIDRDQTV
jgi:hypothetical protein